MFCEECNNTHGHTNECYYTQQKTSLNERISFENKQRDKICCIKLSTLECADYKRPRINVKFGASKLVALVDHCSTTDVIDFETLKKINVETKNSIQWARRIELADYGTVANAKGQIINNVSNIAINDWCTLPNAVVKFNIPLTEIRRHFKKRNYRNFVSNLQTQITTETIEKWLILGVIEVHNTPTEVNLPLLAVD
eukprot:Awhi_evm2s8160